MEVHFIVSITKTYQRSP